LDSPSSANGRIAFVSHEVGSAFNADIYTINPDGSDRRRLTFDSREDSDPAWSPDGTKIAFARSGISVNSYRSEIYVMNADGSYQRRLTEPGGDRYYRHPTWSPDGTKIAFHTAIYDGRGSVIVMNADGSDQRNIFQGGLYQPAWSPDGSKLVGSTGEGLRLINIDGSNPTPITQPPTPFDPATYFWDQDPDWSPDSSKIVFTRFVNCDINDCYSARLYVVNSDGSNPTELRPQDDLGGSLVWSPDGTKILLGGGDLYVMNPDGSGLTNLTNTNDRPEYSPSWQPLALPPAVNPMDDAQLFVRQQYRDFLNREPDAGGLAYWTSEITKCGTDADCVHERRIGVSGAFFAEPEFQHRRITAPFSGQPYFSQAFYLTVNGADRAD
jgi:Tol biopolymer transport system component